MLYFADDKNLLSPFGRIWDGAEAFLDLCEPTSRVPQLVEILSGPPRPEASCDYTTQETAVNDGTKEGLARCLQLYDRARDVWRLPLHSVYLRWEPTIGPLPHDLSAFDLNRQLTLAQIQSTNRTWAFVHLLTSFEMPDQTFLEFVAEANRRLPFKLQASRWRNATIARSGRTILRKVKWPV